MAACRTPPSLPGSSSRRGFRYSWPCSGSLSPGAALLRDTNDQIGQIVAKTKWRLAVFTAAWRLTPAASLRRGSVHELVEARVNVAIRVRVIMRPNEQYARSARGLECDDDPERSTQVLDAHAADWHRAGEPVSERRTAVAREVIDEGPISQRVLPVEVICLLLRAPRGDYLHGHT